MMASHRKQHIEKEDISKCLAGWNLAGVVVSLNAANGVAFVDLLGVTAIFPAVSDFFTDGGSIAWAATTQLIGATVGLAILGYLSDTWSRRLMLLISIGLLALSSLACGLSSFQNRTDLFCALRTFSGIATGSISNLVNIAQNDFLPEQKRLKYQGVQGVSVAMGSIMGMMVGAVFASEPRWHYFYYFVVGLSVLAWLAVFFCVPANCRPPPGEQIRSVLKAIDYYGILSGAATVVAGLLLLSKYSDLERAVVIALAVITAVSTTIFLVLGFLPNRGAIRPIVPFKLFRNRTIATILVQNVLFGATYYSFSYYLPLNLQVVRELPALTASVYQVPYYVTHGAWSTVSALVILQLQKRGWRSYSLIFFCGFAVWTVAMVVLALDSEYRVRGLVNFLSILVGIGTGSSFQNSVLAISVQADRDTKALAVGTRNVLRSFGGALGTAVSSAVLQQRLQATLPRDLPADFHIADSAFSHASFERLSDAQRAQVEESYDGAIMWVFFVSAIFMAVCFLLCPLIKDQSSKPTLDCEGAESPELRENADDDDVDDDDKKSLGADGDQPNTGFSQTL
ncbi:hypothetical protein AC579_4878 [Pseudocercospora musae]|uniref:Major facilitator superfamily (MFS) profile domain-containing protein n=1 Tax=Pseudocercospora musae TaxID=113226 RepID=A0A139IK11_9PEZI|nr:hypothetical protein AC579_4878 [Pseudocercospora musae]